jgi:integrase
MATSWLSTQRSLIESGEWVNPAKQENQNPKFLEYAKRHIQLQTNKGSQLRKNTQDLYSRLLENHLKAFHLEHLKDISKSEVDQWYQQLLKKGKATTAAKAYSLLSAVMSRAAEDGAIKANPCRIKGARSASTGRKRYVPSSSEISEIASNINPRFKELILFAAYSGLRFSELTALEVKDLAKTLTGGGETYSVSVSKAVTYSNGVYTLSKPKTSASARSIALPISLTPVLDNYLAKRKPTDLLFPSASGTYLNHGVLINALKAAMRKADLNQKGLGIHSFRHYAATQLVAVGATIPEIQKFLGDSTVAATMTYIHDTGRSAELIQRVPKLGN